MTVIFKRIFCFCPNRILYFPNSALSKRQQKCSCYLLGYKKRPPLGFSLQADKASTCLPLRPYDQRKTTEEATETAVALWMGGLIRLQYNPGGNPHHMRLKAGSAWGLALHPGAGERIASQGGIMADGLNLITRETSSGAGASLPL